MNANGWQPAVRLDVDTATPAMLDEAIAKFSLHFTDIPLQPLRLRSGWHNITPQMAETLLRRNQSNRKPGLRFIKKYARSMLADEWKPTGEPILIDTEGWVQDAQHRLLSCYFSGATFRTYIVADVPADPNLFAYIDNGKSRSAADAIYTSGNGNGASSMVAAGVKIGYRYDNDAFRLTKQPALRELEPIEYIGYAAENPGLSKAAHLLTGTYSKAVGLIKHKGVAAFFAWKVDELYGAAVLHEFLTPLASGANLDEDSPILALRTRLLASGSKTNEDPETVQQLVGLMIAGFNLFINKQVMKPTKRGGIEPLTLSEGKPFPRFIEPQDVQQAAD